MKKVFVYTFCYRELVSQLLFQIQDVTVNISSIKILNQMINQVKVLTNIQTLDLKSVS